MNTDQQKWQDWVAVLQKRGLADLVAFVMEATAPLAAAGAQVLVFSEPVISAVLPYTRIEALADLLENDCDYRGFIRDLKKDHTK